MNTAGTVADLHASATRITGLADFGPDDYTDGLGVLLESYARDAGLTPLGEKVTRALLRGALVARLLSEAGWQRHLGYAEVAVERPVFVTGLPRTGTTALHRLLAADPAHQGLELWLAEAPQPRPPRPAWAGDPVFQRIQAACARHHVEHPEFMGVHYIAADQVEECWQLLRQSMRSVSFECLAHLPGYSAWLRDQDWTEAYRRHRRNLQLIGLNDTGRRWALKNPSHLFALDALLGAYPDALVIQTHRAPRAAIASVCSLAAQASAGWSARFRGPVIGQDQLTLWASGLERFTAERARHDPARFYDVAYDDFVADPFGTVEAAYGFFGLPLSGAAADAMRSLVSTDETGRGPWPAHRYTLADFGLTGAEVDERFAAIPGVRTEQALGQVPRGCDNAHVSSTRQGSGRTARSASSKSRSGAAPAGRPGPAGAGGGGPAGQRRADVVQLAGELFAQKGFRATTVREIADAAGILSGSLYHHFDSKESIADEILSGFINDVLADYRAAVSAAGSPRDVLEQIVRSTSRTLARHRAALAMLQNDWSYFAAHPRFSYLRKAVNEIERTWVTQLERGQESGMFRADLDPRLTYRLLRDVLWIPSQWRVAGGYSTDQVAEALLQLLFHGITS
jgi:AcrR family transcriptional regulator